MPTFYPPLRSTHTITLPPSIPPTFLYFTCINFTNSAAPELWTNFSKTWTAHPFVPLVDGSGLAIVKLPLVDSEPGSFEYTYRLKHFDERVEWLGSDGSNGVVDLVAATSDDKGEEEAPSLEVTHPNGTLIQLEHSTNCDGEDRTVVLSSRHVFEALGGTPSRPIVLALDEQIVQVDLDDFKLLKYSKSHLLLRPLLKVDLVPGQARTVVVAPTFPLEGVSSTLNVAYLGTVDSRDEDLKIKSLSSPMPSKFQIEMTSVETSVRFAILNEGASSRKLKFSFNGKPINAKLLKWKTDELVEVNVGAAWRAGGAKEAESCVVEIDARAARGWWCTIL